MNNLNCYWKDKFPITPSLTPKFMKIQTANSSLKKENSLSIRTTLKGKKKILWYHNNKKNFKSINVTNFFYKLSREEY